LGVLWYLGKFLCFCDFFDVWVDVMQISVRFVVLCLVAYCGFWVFRLLLGFCGFGVLGFATYFVVFGNCV